MAHTLIERERALLQVIARFGGRAPFDVIETAIEVRFRKHLWPTLMALTGCGMLTRERPGTYTLTSAGTSAVGLSSDCGTASDSDKNTRVRHS